MYNIKLKNTEAFFSIDSIDIKNFYAYLNCSVKSFSSQVVPRGFVFKYLFNDREYPIGINRYWIDVQPLETSSSYTEINTNKLLKFSLKINLFGGNIINLNLTKTINFLIYESNQLDGSNEKLFWKSPEIFLISKNISIPTTTYSLTGKNKKILLDIKHNWFTDYDFNYYSDDFKVIVEINHINEDRIQFQSKFITSKEQQFIFLNIDDGYYYINIKVMLFNGFVIYSVKDEIYIEDEKVKGYIKISGNIQQIKDVYYKSTVDDQIKYWVTSTDETPNVDNGFYWTQTYDILNATIDNKVRKYDWPDNTDYDSNVVVAWAQTEYPSYIFPLGTIIEITVTASDSSIIDYVYLKNIEYVDTIKIQATDDTTQEQLLEQLNILNPPVYEPLNAILKVPVYAIDVRNFKGELAKKGFLENNYRFIKHIFIRIEQRPVKKITSAFGMSEIFKETVY